MNLVAVLHQQNKKRTQHSEVLYARGGRGNTEPFPQDAPDGTVVIVTKKPAPVRMALQPMAFCGVTIFLLLSFDRETLKEKPPLFINKRFCGTNYVVDGCLLYRSEKDYRLVEKRKNNVFLRIGGAVKSLFIKRGNAHD